MADTIFYYSDGTMSTSSSSMISALDYNQNKFVNIVSIGDGVTGISNNTFYNKQTLYSLSMPNSLKYIGQYAFWQCYGLNTIQIGSGVEKIDEYAFWGAGTNIVFPESNSLKEIGRNAFEYSLFAASNNNNVNIKIPNSVTGISQNAFASSKIRGVVLGDGVEFIDNDAFSYCQNLKNITLNKNLNIIGAGAFLNSTAFNNIVIPKSVNTIRAWAFRGTSSLTNIYFEGNIPINFFTSAFSNSNPNLKLYRKKNFVTGWSSTFAGKPVVLWSDNVIKSGGTKKLVGLPRTYS